MIRDGTREVNTVISGNVDLFPQMGHLECDSVSIGFEMSRLRIVTGVIDSETEQWHQTINHVKPHSQLQGESICFCD